MPFISVESLADVAWQADVQFQARPCPVTQRQFFRVPQELWEFNEGFRMPVHYLKDKAGRPTATSMHVLAGMLISIGIPATGPRFGRKIPLAGSEEPLFLP